MATLRPLPPLNALRAFEVAARRGSFKAAADELHVTATAVSHQVRHLESQIGHELFTRRPRPIRLTASGQRLFDGLREGFERIGDAVAAVTARDRTGPLVVTTTPAFASRWLIPRLSALRRACDGLDLAIEASEDVTDLRAGGVDFAIRYARDPDPAYVCRALASDRYLPVCRPELLGSERRVARLEDLGRLALIHYEWKRADPGAPTWKRWRDRAGRMHPGQSLPRHDHELRFSEEIHAIEAAIDGHGVALVSELLVARELATGLLVTPVDLEIDGRTFYAMYPEDSPRRQTIEPVVDYLARALNTSVR